MTEAVAYAPVAIEPAALAAMQASVLEWYATNGRQLAFRRTSDPWAILVSEVMAQQTQAARAAEAWTRFMAEFPTPAALAAASPAAVIRAWRGLGYNRRALALRGAAISIVEEHDGVVPDSLDALIRLPGVGPYTARAVLAISFDQPIAALDVNVRRVLGRAFLGSSVPSRDFQQVADALVPKSRSATWTHALMDIGAAFCRPGIPRCDSCPLREACIYRAQSGEAPTRGRAARHTNAARPIRFESTTRWLRGRIVDRLRDARDGTWTTFDEPIGPHPIDAVALAVAALAREGTLELQGGARLRARLPIAMR